MRYFQFKTSFHLALPPILLHNLFAQHQASSPIVSKVSLERRTTNSNLSLYENLFTLIMKFYTFVALLGTSLASGAGEIGKPKETQAKDASVMSSSAHMASMLIPSGAISMNVNTKTNIQGHIQPVC